MICKNTKNYVRHTSYIERVHQKINATFKEHVRFCKIQSKYSTKVSFVSGITFQKFVNEAILNSHETWLEPFKYKSNPHDFNILTVLHGTSHNISTKCIKQSLT